MKIERVDDKTVKCFLSNEELEEHNIDYKDFITRTDKARELMQQIIETAAEEVGYKPPKFAFDLQIMMMPNQGMVLTLSEKDPLDLSDKDQIMAYLKSLGDLFHAAKERFEAAGVALAKQEQPAENSVGIPVEAASDETAGKAKAAGKQAQSRPEYAIFRFEEMRNLLAYASVMPQTLRVKSSLYAMDHAYYLYVHRGTASYERYSRACVQALEYATLYAAEEGRLLHLEEHGECLIAENALKKLKF